MHVHLILNDALLSHIHSSTASDLACMPCQTFLLLIGALLLQEEHHKSHNESSSEEHHMTSQQQGSGLTSGISP